MRASLADSSHSRTGPATVRATVGRGEREVAAEVLEDDPRLERHPELREALARRLDEEAEAFLAKN